MIYIESKTRSLQEQQDYEISMKSKWEKSTTRRAGANNNDFSEMKHQPRRARKYVIFDAETGEVVFEYGGVQNKQITAANADGEMVKIYELGMMI